MIFDPVVIVKGSNSYNMPLIVTAEPGAKAIATLGDITVSSVANLDGQATLLLPAAGEYTVHTELDGVTSSYKTIEAPGSISIAFNKTRLPAEYTELEYVDNAASIDAKKAYARFGDCCSNMRIEFDMEIVKFPTGNYKYTYILGSYAKSGSYYTQLALYVYNGTLKIISVYNNTNPPENTLGTFSTPSRIKCIWDYINSKITINGTTLTAPKGTDYSSFYKNLYLFQLGSITDFTTSADHGIVRLYSFKMYNGDTLYADIVPAKRNSDGVVGLYNMVNGNFFWSATTDASFVAGPAV